MIQVIDRACTLLEEIAAHPDRGATSSELAGRLGVNPPTCANILRSLAGRGMVEQRKPRGPWFLGPTLRQLAHPREAGLDAMIEAADPLLPKLAETTGASIEIVELNGVVRIHHRRAHPNSEIQVAPLYDHMPLLLTGSGRLLLALHEDQDLAIEIATQQHVRLDGSTGQDSREDLRAAFAAVRRAGRVVIHQGTGSPDISAGAVPLKRYGRVVMALGWFMPRSHFKQRQLRIINTELRAAADTIERAAQIQEDQR